MKFSTGLGPEENAKVINLLEKVIPYLNTNQVYLVGGLVARYFINEADIGYESDGKFNDIDFIFDTFTAINPSITNKFLVHHYHSAEPGRFLSLVDAENSIRVEFFDAKIRPISESVTVDFETSNISTKIKMRSLEDQYVEYVRDCYKIINIEGFKNKKHYYTDVKLLHGIADLGKAQKLYETKDNANFPASPVWKNKKTRDLPEDLETAYQEAVNFAEMHPEVLIKGFYTQIKGPRPCEWCVRGDKDYSIARPEEIFDAMGWEY